MTDKKSSTKYLSSKNREMFSLKNVEISKNIVKSKGKFILREIKSTKNPSI